MRGWTFPIGRVFGVEIRIHSFFLLVLMLCLSYASILDEPLSRGFGLGCLLLLAVVIREIARGLAGAWHGLQPVSVLLLPTGGLVTYVSQEPPTQAAANTDDAGEIDARELKDLKVQRDVALAGPIANFIFGLIFGALILTLAPEVNLVHTPWISPHVLLRSLVWVNLLLGAVNLLPAWPLDGGRIFRSMPGKDGKATPRVLPTAIGIGPVIAIALIVGGLVVPNMWLLMIGIFVLIASQFETQGRDMEGAANTLTMSDVMMQDYTTLSASATLEDAMRQATHTLQDVFPVVRGGNLVGAVSRQHIADALSVGGNSYVQGIMTRSFRTAKPGDPLLKTLRRIMSGAGGTGAQLVPIVEADSERIVGIITPQNLQRSMGLLDQSRRIREDQEFIKKQDEL